MHHCVVLAPWTSNLAPAEVIGGSRLVGWLVWLVGWLVGLLVVWLVGWLVGCWLVGWLVGRLVGWLVGWFGWLVGLLFYDARNPAFRIGIPIEKSSV